MIVPQSSLPHSTAKFLTVIAFLLLALPSYAQVFTIEVVVFEARQSTSDERWSPRLEYGLEDAVSLPNDASMAGAGEMFVRGERLAHVTSVLRADKRYRVLRYIAWDQEGQAKPDAPIIPIVLQPATLDRSEPSLRGAARFYRGTFLQFEVNLRFRPQPTTTTTIADPALDFRQRFAPVEHVLAERRRVRLNEIHYLDHPRLGVIMTVWRR